MNGDREYDFTFRVARASTGELEEIPTRVVELKCKQGMRQEYDPRLVLNAGDKVLEWPTWKVSYD